MGKGLSDNWLCRVPFWSLTERKKNCQECVSDQKSVSLSIWTKKKTHTAFKLNRTKTV